MIIFSSEESVTLDHFGIGYLTVIKAAALIVKCLYFEGEIEISIKDERKLHKDDNYDSIFNQKLDTLLCKDIEKYIQYITDALKNGSLKSDLIKHDLEDNIIPDKTYINFDNLLNWLSDKDIDLGTYLDEYIEFEQYLANNVEQFIEKERIKKEYPNQFKHYLDLYNQEPEIVIQAVKTALIEKEERNSDEKPLHKSEKKTLQSLFIGMLALYYGLESIKNNQVKSPEISKDLLEKLQIDITDDTIRKHLKESLEFLPKF